MTGYSLSINGFGFGPDAASLSTGDLWGFTTPNGDKWGITEVSGLKSLPEVRTNDVNKPQSHGTYIGTDLLQGRTISLTLRMTGGWTDTAINFARYMRTLELATQVSREEKDIIIKMPGWGVDAPYGQTTIRTTARVRRREITMNIDEYGLQAPIVDLDLYCGDPRLYSVDSVLTDFTSPTPANGYEYDLEMPVDYGGTSGVTVHSVDNYGTAIAYPVIKFWGPCVNPFLINLSTVETLSLNSTIASGDYIEVNFLDQTVLLNGVTNKRNEVRDAQFWGLHPSSASTQSSEGTFLYFGTRISYGYFSGSDPAHCEVVHSHTWI